MGATKIELLNGAMEIRADADGLAGIAEVGGVALMLNEELCSGDH